MILDGVRVADLTDGIAGAYCTKLLTDLGADVALTEADGSHPLRARDDGALFDYLRASQRSTDIAPGALAADADIVVRGPSGPAVDALVTVVITAVGRGGPDDGLELPEPVLQARSGSLSGKGHAHLPPLTLGGDLGEYVTGAFAALSAMTAWYRASRTGTPETVDVSKLEAMQMTLLTAPTLMARFPGARAGAFRWVMIPGNEPTADGRYVGITTVTVAQWIGLLGAMGRDDLTGDETLYTMLGRGARADETNAAVRAWTTSLPADALEAQLVAARVPAAIVGNGHELPRFAQLVARDVYVPQPGRPWVRPRAPFRFAAVADRPLAAAPRRGAHDATPWPDRRPSAPTRRADAPGPRPLAGLRVVDFTAFWAGPFATAWLAALGADVVKVESTRRPDGIRFAAAVHPRDDPLFYEQSALFHASNLAKRGVTLDLAHPDGLELARELIRGADVVAENFTPRVMDGFGLDADGVQSLNPSAIYLRIPAFGLTGPWRDRPGFAQTMEQLTGMAWVTGYDGGPPIIPGGVVDPLVGTHAALAVMAALEHRARTGEGGLVEVPLVEVAAAVTAEQVIRTSIDGVAPGRRGARGVFRCAGDDAWIASDGTADDLTPVERARWCATRAPHDAARELRAMGVAAWPVVPAFATLDDPQLRARGFFEAVEHPVVGTHDFPTWPMRLSAGPHRWWQGPAPMLGQHTDEVLRELGVDDDRLARLRRDGVIGDRPASA